MFCKANPGGTLGCEVINFLFALRILIDLQVKGPGHSYLDYSRGSLSAFIAHNIIRG